MADEVFLTDETSLDALLTGFHDGTWPIADWHHSQHLAVCACYVLEGGVIMDRLRIGIATYNERQGGKNTLDSGYHETLTRFWLERVAEFVHTLPPESARLEVTRLVVSRFGPHRDLFKWYYDFDVVTSREARARWIPPVTVP